MTIIMTGGTGFIGRQFVKLLSKKHHCIVVSRNPDRTKYQISWDEEELIQAIKKSHGLIHMAGTSIASGLWTKSFKKKLIRSRVQTGELLNRCIIKSEHKLDHIIQFSGVGYYGDRGDEILTEKSRVGEGFMSDLALKWEASLNNQTITYKHTIVRLGIVLGDGGLLQRIKTPFKLGLGTSFGNGKQYVPWISLTDLNNALFHIFEKGEKPVYNLTSPTPLSAKQFYKSIAKAWNRPLFLTVPSFFLKLLPGGMGKDIFLASQRVIPESLLNEGFSFENEIIDFI